MNQKVISTMALVVGMLFCISNAYGVTSVFGGVGTGDTISILEVWDTNPGGSASSDSTLIIGDGIALQQSTEINGLDYAGERSESTTSGDYVKVTWNLVNADVVTHQENAIDYGSYAVANEEWDITYADKIEFSAYARSRIPKSYMAKVTTDIEKGGVVFSNEAYASSLKAQATQTLNSAWGDEITRTLSSRYSNKVTSLKSHTATSYSIEEDEAVDYVDTAKATSSGATLTSTGGPVQQPSPPSGPVYQWPVSTGPSYPRYQWPVGLGW